MDPGATLSPTPLATPHTCQPPCPTSRAPHTCQPPCLASRAGPPGQVQPPWPPPGLCVHSFLKELPSFSPDKTWPCSVSILKQVYGNCTRTKISSALYRIFILFCPSVGVTGISNDMFSAEGTHVNYSAAENSDLTERFIGVNWRFPKDKWGP